MYDGSGDGCTGSAEVAMPRDCAPVEASFDTPLAVTVTRSPRGTVKLRFSVAVKSEFVGAGFADDRSRRSCRRRRRMHTYFR